MVQTGAAVEAPRNQKLRAAYIRADALGDRERANRLIAEMPHLICINGSNADTVADVYAFGEAYWPRESVGIHASIEAIRADRPPVIPKIIHFVWIGGPLPDWAQKNIDTAKALHPGWDIFVHGSVEQMPDALRQAAKACEMFCVISDIMRFWALQKWGGFYLDTDVTLYRSLEPLRKLPVFASESFDSRPYCAVMGAVPNDPLINRLADTIRSIHERYGKPTSRIAYGPDNIYKQRDGLLLLARHLFYEYRNPFACRRAFENREHELGRIAEKDWPYNEPPFGLHVFGLEVPGKGRSSYASVTAVGQ